MRVEIEKSGALVLAALTLVACGGGGPPDAGTDDGGDSMVPPPIPSAECEVLDPDVCLLPWPSNHFTEADPTSATTGMRVSIPESAMFSNNRNVRVDPGPWNDGDGFSPATTAMAQLPVRIDVTNLPCWQDDAPGLADTSPTVLLDADTGERVAHFAEIEESDEADPTRSTLYIRPMTRLAEGRRYVVAIRGLTDEAGAPVPPSWTFEALRDGVDTGVPQVEARRPSLEADVFAPLADAGVAREELILAWDFTTATGASAWGDLLAMSIDAFALAGDEGLGCDLGVRTDTDHSAVFRELDGTFTVPLFLESTEHAAPMRRDADGRPVASGTHEANVRVIIPQSVAEAARVGEPSPVMLYGHGLFNDRLEATEEWLIELADREGFIIVATEFTGMAADDYLLAVEALTELSAFDAFFARVQQGIVNTLLLPRTFAHQCAGLLELEIDGMPTVDPTRRWYHGNSQGGILGITLAALSPDIDRFGLGVGGIEYPIMLPRSLNWPMLEDVFAGAYPNRLERDLAMVMFASRWELVEGSAFAPHALSDALPGARARDAQILFQIGLDDVQTPNVASEIAARTLGLPQSSMSDHAVWGLAPFDTDSRSAFVVFDYDVDALPKGNATPTEENGVHEMVRRDPEAQDQLMRFLREGLVAPE